MRILVCSFVVIVYTHFIANQGKSASAAQTDFHRNVSGKLKVILAMEVFDEI